MTKRHVHGSTGTNGMPFGNILNRAAYPERRGSPTHQDGPRGFLLAVTQAPGLGLLHLVAMDPSPQLMDQPAPR